MPFADRDSFEAILSYQATQSVVLVKLVERVDARIRRRHREGYLWGTGDSLALNLGDRATLALADGALETIRITGMLIESGDDSPTSVMRFVSDKHWKDEDH